MVDCELKPGDLATWNFDGKNDRLGVVLWDMPEGCGLCAFKVFGEPGNCVVFKQWLRPVAEQNPEVDVNSFASTIFGRTTFKPMTAKPYSRQDPIDEEEQILERKTYLIADAGDREFIIESDLADKMVPGKEYSVLNGQYLIRRDGIKLHARKVETYDRLIDLR